MMLYLQILAPSELCLAALGKYVWNTMVCLVSGHTTTPALQNAGLLQSAQSQQHKPSIMASHRALCHVSSTSSPARLSASKDLIKLLSTVDSLKNTIKNS